MKKVWLIMILAFGSLAAFEPTEEAFRDMKCGDPISKLGKNIKTKKDKNFPKVTYAVRPSDKMSIGEVDLDSIVYMFFENRLMRVVAGFNYSDFYYIKEAMAIKYGVMNFKNAKECLRSNGGTCYQSLDKESLVAAEIYNMNTISLSCVVVLRDYIDYIDSVIANDL